MGIVNNPVKGGVSLRTDWVWKEEMGHILAALTPANRLACEISMTTGLRIGDVLSLTTQQVLDSKDGRVSVIEHKTGKRRRVRIPIDLWKQACRMAGERWVFQGRTDWTKHRTRQAVYKDLKAVAAVFKVRHGLKANIAPHSLRKVYAVGQYQKTGDLKKVQKLLNHSNEAVTMIYAMADTMTQRRVGDDRERYNKRAGSPSD